MHVTCLDIPLFSFDSDAETKFTVRRVSYCGTERMKYGRHVKLNDNGNTLHSRRTRLNITARSPLAKHRSGYGTAADNNNQRGFAPIENSAVATEGGIGMQGMFMAWKYRSTGASVRPYKRIWMATTAGKTVPTKRGWEKHGVYTGPVTDINTRRVSTVGFSTINFRRSPDTHEDQRST